MKVELIKMLSKGRIVMPQNIREYVGAGGGTRFLVICDKDTIILKEIQKPKEVLLKDFEKMAMENRKKLEIMGIKESDIPKIVHRYRGIKE